ncbi:hypothetical protein BGW38_004202 [Lunasporangiospora selenospora]|uniref:Uncharacterized protein n=1 Tax=Lunasporangiospora selenospora TaxID=979761 RepID=A0A9P6FQT8_9FUNG|nr:hypothetical protein BGW38_004202 [Lunasporangiospora selenospora]
MPPPIPPKPQTLTQEQYCVVDASFYDPIDSYIPLRSVDPVNTGLLTPDTSPVSTPVISFINTKSDRSLSVPSVIAKLDIPPPSTHVATVGYATSALHYNASIESESPGQSDTDQVRGREPMLQESVTSHFSGYRMSLSTTAPSVLDTRPASHAMYSVTSFENSGPGPQLTGRSSSSSGSSSSGNGSEGNEGVSGRNHDGATTASARSSEQKYQQRRRLSDIISRNVRSRKNSILAIFGSHPSEELQQQSLDQKQQQQRRSTTTSSSDSSHKLVRKDKKKLDKKQKKKDLYHNSGGSNGSSSSSSDGSNGRDTSGQSSVEECMTGKSGGNMIQRASWYMRRSSTSGDRTTSESSTRPEPASRPRSESASSSTVFAKRLSASLNFSPKLSFVPTARSVSSSALPVTTGSGSLSSSSERSTPSPPLAPISSQSSQPLLQLPPRQRLSHQFQAQFYTSQEMASRHLPTSTSESEPNRRRRDVDLMLDLDDTNNSRQSQPPSPPYERYANSGAYPTSPTLPPPPPPPYRPRSMTISGRYAPGSVPLSAQYRYAMSSGNTCATGSLFDSVSDSDSDDSDVDDGYGFRYASPPPVQPRVVPHYPELPSPREVQTLCGSDASRGQLSSSQEYTSSSQYRVYDSDDDMEDDTSENESDSQDDEDDEEDDEEEEPLQTWRQQQQQQQQHQQESQVVIGGDRRRRQTLEGYMHRFDEGAPPPSYEQLQQQQGPAVTLESSANLGTLLELLHEFEDHLLESSRTLGFQSLTNTGSVPSRRQAWLGRQPQTMPSFAYIMIELEQLGILGSAKVSAWTEPMAGLGTLTMSQQEWLDRTGNATTEAQLARSMLALEKSCVLGMDHARWVPETQRRWRARLLALADA